MRIRTIKPGFWRWEKVTQLSRDLRLLFVGVWSYVDDNGVGVDDYRQLAADLFALEDDPAEARQFVRDGLATLSRASLILRYEANGTSLLFVVDWDDWQRVDHPGKDRYPRPTTPLTSTNPEPPASVTTLSREARETLAPGKEEEGKRGREETHPPTGGGSREGGKPPRTPEPATPPTAKPTGGRGGKGTRIPDDFAVTDAMIAWARDHTPLVGREDTEAFQDHWRSATRNAVKRDWVAAWRNWMRRAQRDAEDRAGRAARPPRGTGASPTGSRPSTADQRVRDTQALKRLYHADQPGPRDSQLQLTPGEDS
jgi:hypothetical protein